MKKSIFHTILSGGSTLQISLDPSLLLSFQQKNPKNWKNQNYEQNIHFFRSLDLRVFQPNFFIKWIDEPPHVVIYFFPHINVSCVNRFLVGKNCPQKSSPVALIFGFSQTLVNFEFHSSLRIYSSTIWSKSTELGAFSHCCLKETVTLFQLKMHNTHDIPFFLKINA